MLHCCCRAAPNSHGCLWGQCSCWLIPQLQLRKQLLCSVVFSTAVALIYTLQYIIWISQKWAYVCECVGVCISVWHIKLNFWDVIGSFDSDPAACQLCFVARVFSHIESFLSYATAGLLFQWPWSKLLCCQKVRVHILSGANRILFELCIFVKDCFGVPLINLINLLEKCGHYSSTCSQFKTKYHIL